MNVLTVHLKIKIIEFGDIMAAEFGKDNFEAEVLGANTPVLVDFWSDG